MNKNEIDLVLSANSLLSKWGFGDGDILGDYTHEHLGIHNFSYNEHKALEELVKMYLLPKLNNKVEIIFIETIHNPIRAEMIDGRYYTNHYSHDDDDLLGDISVSISSDEVKDVLKHFGYKEDGQNE